MVLSSTHERLTRTSSDLRKLSAILLPPSPILKADDLPIASTSGEIPILLGVMTHVRDSPLSTSGGPPRLHDAARGLKLIDKLDITIRNTRGLTRSNEASPEESDDMHTTPGFSNGLNGRHEAEPPSDSSPVRALSERENVIYPAHDDVLGADAEHSCPLSDHSTPIFVKQGKFQGRREDPQATCASAVKLSTTAVTPEEDLSGDQLLTIATFHTYSTLPTPTFAPPSPSSSVDGISLSPSLVDGPRHRRPLERARAVRFPGRPRSPRLQVNEAEPNFMQNASPLMNHASPPRQELTGSAPLVLAYSCTPETRICDAVHPFMKHVALPEGLSWLKNTMIELWIDQEGFRAVRSHMQLMGYSPRTRSLLPYESGEDDGSCVTAGIAEFMPTKRETFAYHYATLDGPPTLRMVSIAGDESRDYVSRQATLSVKADGVYTVLGTETFVASMPNSDTHGLRLRWKFDYLVSDRRVDGTGKILPGEKTLTPLTFSCSPYLLHPLQGKKAGLMHIMKKNLVPKLGSQKVEPPTRASTHRIVPPASRYLSAGRDATHARSHSDATAKHGQYLLTRSPPDTGVRGGSTLGTNHIRRGRRRRASSAGENSLTCLGNESDLVCM